MACARRRDILTLCRLLDEVGVALAGRFLDIAGTKRRSSNRKSARDRRRAVEAALFLDESCHTTVPLERLAADAGLTAFHFLRSFKNVLGVTPHQYLVRARLRRAAHLLASDALPITDIAFADGFDDTEGNVVFEMSAVSIGGNVKSYRARRFAD